MISSADLNGKLAIDANGLNDLKLSAKDNSPEAIKGVAKQFEAIFMNMMLKSMRDATSQDSPFENEQTKSFTSMLDQQLSSNLSSKGLGLSEVLTRQLSKISNIKVSDSNLQHPDSSSNSNNPSSQKIDNTSASPITNNAKSSGYSAASFQSIMGPHAEAASRETGIPAQFMMGQAALESGWGKHEIKGSDGTKSHNLFGIKANKNWKGKVVEATTTEYINGVKQTKIEKFRAYDSYKDSFKDFANLMQNNSRYQKVMANLDDPSGYAKAIQTAGYATDPNYSNKLMNVIQKIT